METEIRGRITIKLEGRAVVMVNGEPTIYIELGDKILSHGEALTFSVGNHQLFEVKAKMISGDIPLRFSVDVGD